MVQQKYTIKREKGKHLTSIERGKIETYFKLGYSKTKIAQLIGISRRTIQREIQRGWVEGLQNSDLSLYNTYSAQKAQRKYNDSQRTKEGNLKIDKNFELINFLENSMLIDKNSPYV
ncbi:helix-turn-helix domain-containing protein, partial [Fusobacterium sp.]|uniref:helix-turn-helix domain-containing protein n=1 Tax=Fusobacterium sp. TaxID=68766 RepID=UPI0025BD2763